VLVVRQKSVLDEAFEIVCAEMPLSDPADHLNIAQSAGASLYIGFEVVGCVVIAMVTRGLLGKLGLEKIRRCPDARRPDTLVECFDLTGRAVEQAGFHQRRDDRDVAGGFRLAFLERSYRVARLQADIPEERQESADRFVEDRTARTVEQDHQVDVRARMELAATVAADGDECDFIGQVCREVAPRHEDHSIDRGCLRVHQTIDRVVLAEALREFGIGSKQRILESGDRRIGVVQSCCKRCGVDESFRSRGGGAARVLRRRAHVDSFLSAAPSVSTSYPVSVMSTVCSH